MAELLNLEKKLAEYKCDTNKAIRLKLVRFVEDLEDETMSFSPLYSHQVFGDEESVFGYKDLEIQLYYSTCSLTTFFNIKYSSKVVEKYDNVEVDNVESKLLEFIPAGYCINLDEFIVQLEKDASFRPFGFLIHSYTVYDEKEGLELNYEIYKTDISCPGFREYHERLQTFLIWFIETASFIDVDDDKWQFFLVFEKYLEDGLPRFATVGYMTVYNFYAYPDKMRPRIGQMLVLPPFQGEGHGAQLLETVQKFYTRDPAVLDITAEEPSEDFVKLRDFVLAKLCQELQAFVPEKLKKGFSAEMIEDARRTWKINKHHSRRVYEILRLRVTNMSDPVQSSEYRLDVKRRLAIPFKKNKKEATRLSRLMPEDWLAQQAEMSVSQEQEYLEETYQTTLEQYRRILERLARV
ncbi:histone acetyltransferase type B catalytic subunit isoform X2 [Stegostoma tigrinum]|uniref:histone acetyltransferase type B catalytic subunit isoform X2 n=1 Tax=Stegostoma tigrinum TaxID=3053191 RepID=UPI00202B07A4|nr:histone acetyltransferase type B catalytic subunit isoform X2 [Stegostoma tigrinum]